MIQLEARVYRGERIVAQAVTPLEGDEDGFVPALERALRRLLRDLDLPLPLWLHKNSREFARFHVTIFFPGQFTETVDFDRLQLRLLEMEAV